MTYLDQVQQPDQTVNNLFNFLGITIDSISPSQTTLRLPFQPHFLQGAKGLAGGIIATLIDEAMAHAVIATLSPAESCVTVDLTVRYLASPPHAEIRAVANITKRGSRLAFVDCDILSPDNTVIAKGHASFMILKRK